MGFVPQSKMWTSLDLPSSPYGFRASIQDVVGRSFLTVHHKVMHLKLLFGSMPSMPSHGAIVVRSSALDSVRFPPRFAQTANPWSLFVSSVDYPVSLLTSCSETSAYRRSQSKLLSLVFLVHFVPRSASSSSLCTPTSHCAPLVLVPHASASRAGLRPAPFALLAWSSNLQLFVTLMQGFLDL